MARSGDSILPLACPCCGYATVSARGEFEICPICYWEDDGQDDGDADVERGGPNRVSLTTGRANFLRFGAAEAKDRAHVRAPAATDRRLRTFVLEGARVVERDRAED